MASGDLLAQLHPLDFAPDNGPITSRVVYAGNLIGLPLGKENGFSFNFEVPANGSPLSTGLTVSIAMVDDPVQPQPGAVIELGVTIVPFITGTTADLDPAYTNEQLATCTINATAAVVTITPIAVANSALSSLAAGNWATVHVRRKGTVAADTHNGRPICLGVVVKDT